MGLRLALSPLFTAAQARAADAWTITGLGVPGMVLLEHAGRAVADVVSARLRGAGPSGGGASGGGLGGGGGGGAGRVLVVCGKGNNGGDGLVCARHLAGRGVAVDVLLHGLPAAADQSSDAASALLLLRTAARQGALPVRFFHGLDEVVGDGAWSVVVDALFGTGLTRPLDGDAAAIVGLIGGLRSRGATVVAVDVPSGWPTDGQRPAGVAVAADVTVTFAGKKIVHVSEPGAAAAGTVVDVDIGLLHPLDEKVTVWSLDGVALTPLDALAHKGRYGHVGVVEGAPGTRGAALLSCRAALRAGAGLVSVIGEGLERPLEVMARPLGAIAGVDVVVVGPGLSTESPAVRAALVKARSEGVRVVADAGAMALLSPGEAECWTPHPGEAARVLGCSSDEVQRDRLAAARALVEKLGGVVVLKGAQPIIASSARCVVVDGRTSALAVAGSGDVLAGVIGAALAGALGPATIGDAVVAAVWLHQRAGRRLTRGAFASEIADAVADVIADVIAGVSTGAITDGAARA